MEIYIDGNDQIVLKKYSPVQNMNDFINEFVESLYATNKKDIIVTDNEKVVAAAGNAKSLINKKISIQLQEKITKRNTQIIEKGEFFEICDNIEMKKAYETMMISVIALSNEDILTASLQENRSEQAKDYYKMNLGKLYE